MLRNFTKAVILNTFAIAQYYSLFQDLLVIEWWDADPSADGQHDEI